MGGGGVFSRQFGLGRGLAMHLTGQRVGRLVVGEVFRTDGNGDCEAGTAARCILILQVALVGLRQHLGIGQSESRTEGGGSGVITNLVVTVKDFVFLIGRHARTIVDDADGHVLSIDILEADDDFAVGVFHGVANEIHHCLHHFVLIHKHDDGLVGQL